MKVGRKARHGRKSNPKPHKPHNRYKPGPATRQKLADRRRRLTELREMDE
jgi:hypothetical protein